MDNISALGMESNLVNDLELPMEVPPEVESIDSSTAELQASKHTKKKRKISLVWTQFDKKAEKNEDGTDVINPDGTTLMKAVCKICKDKLVFGGVNGTSHLTRHMNRCVLKSSTVGGQPIIGRNETGGVYYFQFNQTVSRRETVMYFIREELLFNKVDKPAFRKWIKSSFGPQFIPPCCITMKKDMMQIFHEEKAVLKEILRNVPGKICFTSDLWSSNQRLGYLCITAHYITSEWKLNKKIISFPMLPSPHNGMTISDALYANILGWGLCDKIGTITLDNASNNDSAVARLKDSFFGNNLMSRDLFHQRCNAHILNLLVKAGLKHVESSLVNIRESVKHVRTSQSKLQKFHENCQSLNMKVKTLPVDVPTRWDSTFIMLKAAIPYQKVFDYFFYDSDFAYVPSLLDWNKAVIMRDFLRIFCESTKLFSVTNYVTSSAVCYQLSKISLVLEKYANEVGFKAVYDDMKAKYNKYWKEVPLALALASCMDPRYKMTTLDLCLDLNFGSQPECIPTEKQMKMDSYTRKLYELFDEYQKKMNSSITSLNEETSNVVEEDDIVLTLLSQRREASIQTCRSDLQRYLEQPTIKVSNKDFNVLNWWKLQEGTYPVLSAMARDLLTIPVSTVPSESAFSASERVISKNRSCLLPETVEALMCLRDWILAEEGLQDEDAKDMEELMAGMEL